MHSKKGFAREDRRSRSRIFLHDQYPEPGHPESDGGDEAGKGTPQDQHVPTPGAVMGVPGEGRTSLHFPPARYCGRR